MKKLLVVASMLFAGSVSQALEIQVAPLALKAEVQAMGMQVGVDGRGVIVLVGEAAQEVAQMAGFAINTAAQMIVLTGQEVDEFVKASLAKTGHAIAHPILATKEVLEFAKQTSLDALRAGRATLVFIGDTTTGIVKDLYKTLNYLAYLPVTVITDVGVYTYKFGKAFLGTAVQVICTVLPFVC